ncbi:patatin-like phospholipase family protein [Ancylobacter sp. 6x-1]|uniref:Patatin-like phospholipase family protein n=1 Tax=Ancylobacter crimeensis TaxID=2579147 RepID=A0ABT0DAY5_9HYPH|nr:patatin-like phospholipase family protein [Ancylobacter crimeensis]MCK0197126.1 patatin-like phospholipase family protein [Ancylobacter crimeensis]
MVPAFVRRLRAGLLLVCVLTLTACAALPRIPYTAEDASLGDPMGIPGVRIWADASIAELRPMLARLRDKQQRAGINDYNILAISGGGQDGAYGAGLLNGWTRSGKRPDFAIVSGVSTGALIAPFAFLGPSYDEKLRKVYTETSASDIITGNPITGFFGEGLFRTDPLREMVARYCDWEMLRAIAEQHRAGRRLYVLTTNLDAQRPVMWNMGAIADSGNPRALELFRDVLVGSASIPGAFSPMMIETERDGRRFEEMHVDGATTMQVLTVPTKVVAAESGAFVHNGRRGYYILLNKKFVPEFELSKRSTLRIAVRAFDTLMKSDTNGTVLDAYTFSRRFNYTFNLGFIPESFDKTPDSVFDRTYMNALFDLGYEAGLKGGNWYSAPPGLYEEAGPQRR